MKVLNIQWTSGLLVKSLLIAVILLQVCIFASFHRAENNKSLSSNCQGHDIVWVQHAGTPRFVLGPVNPYHTPGIGIAPFDYTLSSSKSSYFKTDLMLFQKGGIALALTTINAP